jgi:hypothetical protein
LAFQQRLAPGDSSSNGSVIDNAHERDLTGRGTECEWGLKQMLARLKVPDAVGMIALLNEPPR